MLLTMSPQPYLSSNRNEEISSEQQQSFGYFNFVAIQSLTPPTKSSIFDNNTHKRNFEPIKREQATKKEGSVCFLPYPFRSDACWIQRSSKFGLLPKRKEEKPFREKLKNHHLIIIILIIILIIIRLSLKLLTSSSASFNQQTNEYLHYHFNYSLHRH
ncbi:hypothetical protein SSS_02741 [Sarcoptes scabiei]|nr:hypothetical protein SSS_02741 [Sarcoptes scabiei]